MARSDNIRADIERISSMSDEEFEAKWGTWCYAQDRDVRMMRLRWINDLEYALPFAVREEDALTELTAAKAAYRDDPTDENRAWKASAVAEVQVVRAEERINRTYVGIVGDAFVGTL
jgi:hypothetical protein